MEKIELILHKIEVNPITVESDMGKIFHKGNTFKYEAGRQLSEGNIEIKLNLIIEDPDKNIRDPLAFIKFIIFNIKESKTASKFIGQRP